MLQESIRLLVFVIMDSCMEGLIERHVNTFNHLPTPTALVLFLLGAVGAKDKGFLPGMVLYCPFISSIVEEMVEGTV